ncbi:hypothetical protein PAMP_007236 [Pampus punctatissimus]
MMKIMFVLLFAVALLVDPTVGKSTHSTSEHNLNFIIDLVNNYNKSITKQEPEVEDVSHLAEGSSKCGDKFFCKVHDILHKRQHKDEKAIMRNLDVYNRAQNFQCSEVLKKVNSTGITVQIPDLLKHLTICSQHRNLIWANGSNP